MTLRFLAPVAITDAILVSSTRAETDYSAWSGATTYAVGDHCIKTATHRIYESVQAANLNHDPATDTTATWWLDIGPTNRWAMFDKTIGTVTSQATPLTVVLDPGFVGALSVLDVSANTITVSMTDGPGGASLYSAVHDMTDTTVILDWWMYFYAPITPRTTLTIDDLPPCEAGRLTVAIAATTTASCGTLTVGNLVDVGEVQAGVKVGIIDYSKKTTDDYGVTSVVARSYAKRIEANLILNNVAIDYVSVQLAAIRATPVVWVCDDRVDSLTAFGWLRDWDVTIAYPQHSLCHLTIEGLV